MSLTGACLRGACTFTAEEASGGGGACHCGMCRKWTGGIFLSVDCGTSVKFADGAPKGSYKGSEWGERVFCKECGSSLLWQMLDGTNQLVSIQCFEDPSQFALGIELFIDRKPSNYALAGERNKMTQAEVEAIFAGDAQ